MAGKSCPLCTYCQTSERAAIITRNGRAGSERERDKTARVRSFSFTRSRSVVVHWHQGCQILNFSLEYDAVIGQGFNPIRVLFNYQVLLLARLALCLSFCLHFCSTAAR